MHKKLAADLTSLAHSILQMKNKEDVFALKTKAHEVYEKLAVLACVEEYFNNTPNPEYTKDELLDLVKKADEKLDIEIEIENIEDMTSSFSESEVDDPITKTEDLKDDEEQQLIESEDKVIESIEEDFVNEAIELILEGDSASSNVQEEGDNLFSQSNEVIEEAIEDELETVEASNEEITLSLEDELKDTIAADVVADLFENAMKKLPEVLECSVITGSHDYLLKIIANDLLGYESFVKKSLGSLTCISSIESTVVLKQTFARGELPI